MQPGPEQQRLEEEQGQEKLKAKPMDEDEETEKNKKKEAKKQAKKERMKTRLFFDLAWAGALSFSDCRPKCRPREPIGEFSCRRPLTEKMKDL